MAELSQTLPERQVALTWAEDQAAQAAAHFKTLRESIGVKVDALMQALSEAREEFRHTEEALEAADERRRASGEQRVVAQTEATPKEQALSERTTERTHAAERLQRFAASGLPARALDYRHWHCFAVQRQQDGQWRKPACPTTDACWMRHSPASTIPPVPTAWADP